MTSSRKADSGTFAEWGSFQRRLTITTKSELSVICGYYTPEYPRAICSRSAVCHGKSLARRIITKGIHCEFAGVRIPLKGFAVDWMSGPFRMRFHERCNVSSGDVLAFQLECQADQTLKGGDVAYRFEFDLRCRPGRECATTAEG
jgi:hypothetical protein